MRTISVAIPNYNRYEMLFEAFEKVYDNDNITEIVITDDCSNWDIYEQIEKKAKKYPKIKLFRNERNLDCFFNKHEAISKCENDWVILLDSDNVINFSYLNSIFQILDWQEDTIYTPCFARPHFDFRQFSGLLLDKTNIGFWIDEGNLSTMLNAANYFINKETYLKVWTDTIDPITSDSIYFCYLWLKHGNKIQVVDGMEYEHRVNSHGNEEMSHYQKNNQRTPQGFHEQILNNLKQMI